MLYAFLGLPPSRRRKRDTVYDPRWYDWILAVLTVPTMLYPAVNQVKITATQGIITNPFELILGCVMIVLLLEACRRALGWVILSIPVFFLLLVFVGPYLNFLHITQFSLNQIIGYLYLSWEGIYGNILDLVGTLITLFIFFGMAIELFGGQEFFVNVPLSLLGRMRGGPGKVAIISSGLFGMISGAGAGNVAFTGTFTIPMMKRTGFSAVVAGAIESAASAGGVFMPPIMGGVAFLAVIFANEPYQAIAKAAIIPALLYYAVLLWQVHAYACKNGIQGLDAGDLPRFKIAFRQGWPFLVPITLLIYLVLFTDKSLTASLLMVIGVLVVWCGFFYPKRLTLENGVRLLHRTGDAIYSLGILGGAAGVLIGSLKLTALGLKLSTLLTDVAGDSVLLLLLLSASACFILGMGLAPTASYVILGALVGPALTSMGVPPLAAHLFLIFWSVTSLISPPIAVNAFVASAIAQAPANSTGWQASRFGIVAFLVPFVFVKHTELLIGVGSFSILERAFAVFATFVSLVFLGAAAEGYLYRKLSWPLRIASAVLGMAILLWLIL